MGEYEDTNAMTKLEYIIQNAFSFLDKNNLKAELAKQYINTILEFAPNSVSILASIDIIGTFTHHKGIAPMYLQELALEKIERRKQHLWH